MSGKSRNNRRKTQGRFTTNPTQYIQFKNRDKYIHIIDNDHIIIINRNTQDTVKSNYRGSSTLIYGGYKRNNKVYLQEK